MNALIEFLKALTNTIASEGHTFFDQAFQEGTLVHITPNDGHGQFCSVESGYGVTTFYRVNGEPLQWPIQWPPTGSVYQLVDEFVGRKLADPTTEVPELYAAEVDAQVASSVRLGLK